MMSSGPKYFAVLMSAFPYNSIATVLMADLHHVHIQARFPSIYAVRNPGKVTNIYHRPHSPPIVATPHHKHTQGL